MLSTLERTKTTSNKEVLNSLPKINITDETIKSQNKRKHVEEDSSETIKPEKKASKLSQDDVTVSKDTKRSEDREIVYTDGSSRGFGKNDVRAGVGAFFGDDDSRNISELLEGPKQTNQRAELTAALKAIRLSNPKKQLEIKTDNKYIINGVTSWTKGWIKKGWKTSTGKEVENKDLFQAIDKEIKERQASIFWTHIPATTKLHGYKMADKLAREGVTKKNV